MLKKRIIPVMLWKDVGLVKGVGFDSWRRTGSILPQIRVYNLRCVDELILLDISATPDGREPDYETVRDVAPECFVPLTVGGGIRTVDHVRNLLLAGADKVSMNSGAFDEPELITAIARRFGSQCVVVSIDARRTAAGTYECFSRSGTSATGKSPVDWAVEAERRGAGEILLTSIERDGSMSGYDLELIQMVSAAVRIPVIAGGGAGTYGHLLEAIMVGGASAAAAASMFQFTQQTPLEAKEYLAARGVPVRRFRPKDKAATYSLA
ncbi:MAG TPA: imidazole glycerol phosphate synthase cyclase subunit [Candidatus Ozemobacteraceae bacterium]|nr:imidazole glycerol phosphate synthase cyclase subunit [Candidatus Ozemobacteraceae bacterium]